jgi:nucleotide-binding universal stress UspA family protein
MAHHILVPMDESDPSWEALEFALSTFPDAEISALHVIVPLERREFGQGYAWLNSPELLEEAQKEGEEFLADVQSQVAERGREVHTHVETGKPASTILDHAEEAGVDQIIMGSHGRTGVSRVLLGSVAERVMRRSPIPVTVVR